jgi:uncharacterized protein YpmS
MSQPKPYATFRIGTDGDTLRDVVRTYSKDRMTRDPKYKVEVIAAMKKKALARKAHAAGK